MKNLCLRRSGRQFVCCLLLVITWICMPAGSVKAAGSRSRTNEETQKSSFASQVYRLEKLLEQENEVLSFRETAVEAAPLYHPKILFKDDEKSGEGVRNPDMEPLSENGASEESEKESGSVTKQAEVTEDSEAAVERPTSDQFLADIRNSYSARLSVIHRFSDFKEMGTEAYAVFRALCGEAERPFYDAYKGAEFENRNLQVLCGEYLAGLSRQYEAAEMAEEADADESAVEAAYYEGYLKRCNVLLELNLYYYSTESPLEDSADLRGTRDIQKIVEKAIEADKEVDREMIARVQTDLNACGFQCGEPDGDAGKNTVLAICHVQRFLGEKEDGIVSEMLENQLKALQSNESSSEGDEEPAEE